MALTKEQILCAELAPGFARLQRVALRLNDGRALDAADAVFLADAFQKIVGGAHADIALEVVRKKGRPAMTGKQSGVWFALVFEVESYRLENKGSTLADALGHVARTRHVAPTTLEDWHKRYRKSAASALRAIAGTR